MRLEQGEVALLDWHLQRMAGSADVFGIPFRVESARGFLRLMLPHVGTRKHPVRARMTLGPRGHMKVEEAGKDVGPYTRAWVDTVAAFDAASSALGRHKTTSRAIYDAPIARAKRMGAHDVILLDADGFVIEAATANVFAQFGDLLVTPDLRSGGLAGVRRAFLLETRSDVVEAKLHVDELRSSNAIFLSNAVRGLMQVELV